MKKWLLVLGMVTCIFGVSACGKAEDASEQAIITEEEALTTGDQLVQTINMICAQGQQEQFKEDPIITASLDSWTSAMGDLGDFVKILENTANISADSAVINVTVEGTKHNAKVEIILDEKLAISSITTSIIYTLPEIMEKAGLNTLLGMGTVFVVLILISLIISLFSFIPKMQANKKNKEVNTPAAPSPVDNTIAQIIEKEEMADSLELVAVITAAIAAATAAGKETASSDGFVVRSIRRR